MAFDPKENLLYKFTTALDDDLVLDCSLNAQALNQLVLWKWNNAANQKFAIRSVGNNRFAIFCSKNNLTVEVPEGKENDGVQIHCSQPNKKANEFWEFIPVTDDKYKGQTAYYIRSHCNKALDVCEGKAKKEAKIIQWAYNGNKNQIWIVEPVW